MLSTGHMMADTCQGAVPALLPFMITRHHFSYAEASSLVLAATVSSSVIQPKSSVSSPSEPMFVIITLRHCRS